MSPVPTRYEPLVYFGVNGAEDASWYIDEAGTLRVYFKSHKVYENVKITEECPFPTVFLTMAVSNDDDCDEDDFNPETIVRIGKLDISKFGGVVLYGPVMVLSH